MRISRWCLLAVLVVASSCGRSPELAWKYKTNGYIYASPIVAGDNVVIGSTDGNLYALNTRTGALAWKARLGNRVLSTPLLHKGTIYVGSDTGDFYALDPANGSTRWRYHTKEVIFYRACGDETGVYFGSRDSGFYKLNFDGSKLWEFRGEYRMDGNCEFYKDLVLTASWDTNLYAVERETGALRWKFSTDKINYGGPSVSGDDVYLTSHNLLYRLNAASGNLINKAELGEINEVLVWKDYVWTSDYGLKRWSKDLKEQHSVKIPSLTQYAPIATDQYIIIGGGHVVTAVSLDLKVLWKYKAEDDFWAPGVVHDNHYYTGNRDTYVYALRLP